MKLIPPHQSIVLLIVLINCCIGSKAQQPCHVSKMTTSYGSVYNFQYDTSGRLQTITAPTEGRVDSFFYYKDSIVITTALNSVRDSKIVYTFNKEGQAIHQKFLPVGYEGWIEDIDYGYKNGRMATVKRITRSYNGPPEKTTISTETFTWRNGNPIKISSTTNGKSSGSENLEYYTKEPFRIGDYNSYEQIMTGVTVLKPSNLLKSISGPIVLKVSYEFDDHGNIISMTEKEVKDSRVTKYEYGCK